MPVVMAEEDWADLFSVGAVHVPIGDLIHPGWWVDGHEGEVLTDTNYRRFGPFDTQEMATQKRGTLTAGKWRVVEVTICKWDRGMVPRPEEVPFE